MSTRLRLKRARALGTRMANGSTAPSENLVAFLGKLGALSKEQISTFISER